MKLLYVDSSLGFYEPYWRSWAATAGGAYTQLLGDRPLDEVVLELLELIP